jgi:RimJ/RimL family protein N-acetyltransferase
MTIPDLTVVEIHHDQANLASAAVSAKLGYEHVATCHDTPDAPGEIGIEWRWRMTRAEQPGRSASGRCANDDPLMRSCRVVGLH